MSHNGTVGAYSHKAATATGAGTWIDVRANTEPTAIQISISGTALVLLETTNDPNDTDLIVDVSQGGTVDTVHWWIPPGAMYVRTNIVSRSSGDITSNVGRGRAVATVVSAQPPTNFSELQNV